MSLQDPVSLCCAIQMNSYLAIWGGGSQSERVFQIKIVLSLSPLNHYKGEKEVLKTVKNKICGDAGI